MFATAAAGALLLPGLIQLGLTVVMVGGGLWLGSVAAERLFGVPAGGDGGSVDARDATIDVEADTVDDEWRQALQRDLREFDDLLRRRDEFKRRGPP